MTRATIDPTCAGAYTASVARGAFVARYAPDLAQWVAVRGEVRVVPTRQRDGDDARERATALCVALNRVYQHGS